MHNIYICIIYIYMHNIYIYMHNIYIYMHNIYRGIALKGGPGQIADLRRGRVFLRGVDTPIQTMIYLYVY